MWDGEYKKWKLYEHSLTAFDNRSAQHLYEKLGYKRDLENFYAYSLKI